MDKLQPEQEHQHRLLRERLNATCPHCKADLVLPLQIAAYDWEGYGPPESRTVECPDCKKEVKFELAWKTVLYWAHPVEEAAK